MKIIGLTLLPKQKQMQSRSYMYLKPDSALVVNNKPFFIPDDHGEYYAHFCAVARINRLGKNVQEKFACRYYEELTIGLNIINHAQLSETSPDAWLKATAFDNSMVVGQFAVENIEKIEINGVSYPLTNLQQQIKSAISEVSRTITIRMGDMVAADIEIPPKLLGLDDVISIVSDNKEILFCRIK